MSEVDGLIQGKILHKLLRLDWHRTYCQTF